MPTREEQSATIEASRPLYVHVKGIGLDRQNHWTPDVAGFRSFTLNATYAHTVEGNASSYLLYLQFAIPDSGSDAAQSENM
jgi:hypothetical protein